MQRPLDLQVNCSSLHVPALAWQNPVPAWGMEPSGHTQICLPVVLSWLAFMPVNRLHSNTKFKKIT